MKNKIKVALADDHVLLRNGLAAITTSLGYNVLFESSNGKEFINMLDSNNLPDVVLMDLSMPEMDGFDTALWLKRNHPCVNVLALSMYDDEDSIIRMLRNGAKGYILKESNPHHLQQAIESVFTKGYHYSEMITGKLIHSIKAIDWAESSTKNTLHLSERETEFLKLASTEKTYKEIAREMHISPRTVDGYREGLFEKLQVKSRIGLVLFAIKRGIVHV